jgi:hypothetical protein
LPLIGTGALSKRKIQVSISLISQATNEDICSVEIVPQEPVKIPQTVSRVIFVVVEVVRMEGIEVDVDEGEPGFAANERI